ncbi:MAG: nucleotide sugar dehydrogenase [Patescibacteria group bacterium]
MREPHVSVIGLGKLGLPLAVCLATKYHVIAVDKDSEKIRQLKRKQTYLFEPRLDSLFQKHFKNLHFTNSVAQAISSSELTFIVVPTPSRRNGSFSLEFIKHACEKMAFTFRRKNHKHTIVITSTVSPLSMDTVIQPLLAALTQKTQGTRFGLCYSPEFISLGNVIRGILNPEFILIGTSDDDAGQLVKEVRLKICQNKPPVIITNFINAEITKLALNTYITTKISFANMIARICEKTPGADADVVTHTLGLDSRIGQKYLRGAVGYGGPCFPRDNLALAAFARAVKTKAELVIATHEFNERQTKFLLSLVKKFMTEGDTVGVAGLTYKVDTNVTDHSPGLMLLATLSRMKIKTIAYDPSLANPPTLSFVTTVNSLTKLIVKANVVVITTPWPEFKKIPDLIKVSGSKPFILIDCWKIIDSRRLPGRVTYVPLGVGLAS